MFWIFAASGQRFGALVILQAVFTHEKFVLTVPVWVRRKIPAINFVTPKLDATNVLNFSVLEMFLFHLCLN